MTVEYLHMLANMWLVDGHTSMQCVGTLLVKLNGICCQGLHAINVYYSVFISLDVCRPLRMLQT